MSLEIKKRIGNFKEIRFRRPTPARLSSVVKADSSAY